MTQAAAKIAADTWIPMTWDEYLQVVENPAYEKASCYYHKGKARLEMSPVGSDHSRDHSILTFAINLFASVKEVAVDIHDNCSYRKAGYKEVQPDLSFYIGENADVVPWGTGIVNLDQFPPPNLVVEVANTSLSDDKGEKRILYEELAVQEYWIVDVQSVEIIAFAINDGGSRQVRESQVLSGLKIEVLESALRQTRESHHGIVGAWLLEQFQDED